jgi:cytochrome P450
MNHSRNEEIWGSEAQIFDPTRFEDKSKEEQLMTFGAGVHACPGRQLALEALCVIVEQLEPAIKRLDETKVSKLEFNRPSLADRDYAYVEFY